jgi:hypothetical protein
MLQGACPFQIGGGMSKTDVVVDKLKRIQELWLELGRAKMNAPEYQILMEKIRVLSAEYQALVDASKKPKESK